LERLQRRTTPIDTGLKADCQKQQKFEDRIRMPSPINQRKQVQRHPWIIKLYIKSDNVETYAFPLEVLKFRAQNKKICDHGVNQAYYDSARHPYVPSGAPYDDRWTLDCSFLADIETHALTCLFFVQTQNLAHNQVGWRPKLRIVLACFEPTKKL